MGQNGAKKIKMTKKLFVTAALFIGMIAGAMVFSSFKTPNEQIKSKTSPISMTDDGWEYWSNVRAVQYYLPSKKKGQFGEDCEVQRRAWCGEAQYRVKVVRSYGKVYYYPVSESPIEGYRYCYYYDSDVWCFNM